MLISSITRIFVRIILKQNDTHGFSKLPLLPRLTCLSVTKWNAILFTYLEKKYSNIIYWKTWIFNFDVPICCYKIAFTCEIHLGNYWSNLTLPYNMLQIFYIGMTLPTFNQIYCKFSFQTLLKFLNVSPNSQCKNHLLYNIHSLLNQKYFCSLNTEMVLENVSFQSA